MVGLVLSTQKMNVLGQSIILFALAGVLTAIGWLSPWLIVGALIIFAALFGGKVADWVGRKS